MGPTLTGADYSAYRCRTASPLVPIASQSSRHETFAVRAVRIASANSFSA